MGEILLSTLPTLLFVIAVIVTLVFLIRLLAQVTHYLSLVNYEKDMLIQKNIQDAIEKTKTNTNMRR